MAWENVLVFLLFKHLNTSENHANPGFGKHIKLWCGKELREKNILIANVCSWQNWWTLIEKGHSVGLIVVK